MGSLSLKIKSLRTLREIDVKGKRVLVRVDFNVPLNDQGDVADDSRMVATLPTIRYLLEQGAGVILMSHLGRPEGKVNDKLRLGGVARRLGELLGRPVKKVDDCVGPAVVAAAGQLQPGEVLLLENLRFHPEEEANDREFARSLASLADAYVDDAFGTAHRAHASTTGVAEFLPSAAGFLMEKEVTMLGRLLTDPDRPFTAVLGGAKIADKIGVLEKLAEKVDRLLLGGGMANTFLKAGGNAMGDSLVDESHLDFARDFMLRARDRGVVVDLPVDLVIQKSEARGQKSENDLKASDIQSPTSAIRVVAPGAVPAGWQALDIGPRTVERFQEAIAKSKTVFWNGPLGLFEQPAFAHGSEAIARAIVRPGLVSVVGGGDSLALLEQAGVAGQVTHASTGGGASLEFLEGRELPGVAVLSH
jgi:phosphoglycerate kinase